MCASSDASTALEAYDILLLLLPKPATGAWPARIAKSSHLSAGGASMSLSSASTNGISYGSHPEPSLVLDFQLVRMILEQLFGAGSGSSSYASKLLESGKLKRNEGKGAQSAAKKSKLQAKLARQLRKGVEENNLIERLDHAESHWMINDTIALDTATAQDELVAAIKDRHFKDFNFSLFSLLFAASLHSSATKCVNLSPVELIQVIQAIYRAMTDASSQAIVADLQILLQALLMRLFQSTRDPIQQRALLQQLCEYMWSQMPPSEADADISNPELHIRGLSRYHSTFYRWCLLTPCSNELLKQVRSGLAWMLLQSSAVSFDKFNSSLPKPPSSMAAPMHFHTKSHTSNENAMDVEPGEMKQDLSDEFSLYPTSPSGSGASTNKKNSYNSVHFAVVLQEIVDFLQTHKIMKQATKVHWSMYANWVLLLDIAYACYDVSELTTVKRLLTLWESAFSAWQGQAKEKSNFDLNMSRFKDVCTHTTTKGRIIANSVQTDKVDPFQSFKKSTGAKSTSNASSTSSPTP